MDVPPGDLIKDVEDLHKRLAEMGPDEILQVDENADSAEIKRSYYRLAKKFHPDRAYDSGDHELKSKIATVFDAITKAYRLLQDDAKRQEYFKSQNKKDSWERRFFDGPSADDARRTALREQFRQGTEEFKSGNFWGATEKFRWLAKEDPSNAKAWSYLSLSLSRIPNRMKEAEEALLQAIKLEPMNAEHTTDLGFLYLKIGLKMRAKKQFEKALSLDPQNARAKDGLEEAR